jgi:hypothetical protein
VEGVLVERSFRGNYYQVTMRHASGVELTFDFPVSAALPQIGEPLSLSLDPMALALLPG